MIRGMNSLLGGWGYVAGFFDGDGTVRFDLTGARHNPTLCFYQSQKNVLLDIRDFLLFHSVESKLTIVKARVNRFGSSESYMLRIIKWNDVEKLCREMLPYLFVKESTIRDILRFRKIYPPLPKALGPISRRERAA